MHSETLSRWCSWWWGHFSTRFNIWFPVWPMTRKADDTSKSEWPVEHLDDHGRRPCKNNIAREGNPLCVSLQTCQPCVNSPTWYQRPSLLWERLPLSREGFFARCFPFGAEGNEDKRWDWRDGAKEKTIIRELWMDRQTDRRFACLPRCCFWPDGRPVGWVIGFGWGGEGWDDKIYIGVLYAAAMKSPKSPFCALYLQQSLRVWRVNFERSKGVQIILKLTLKIICTPQVYTRQVCVQILLSNLRSRLNDVLVKAIHFKMGFTIWFFIYSRGCLYQFWWNKISTCTFSCPWCHCHRVLWKTLNIQYISYDIESEEKNLFLLDTASWQVLMTVLSTFSWWRRQCYQTHCLSQHCMLPTRTKKKDFMGGTYSKWIEISFMKCAAVSILHILQ